MTCQQANQDYIFIILNSIVQKFAKRETNVILKLLMNIKEKITNDKRYTTYSTKWSKIAKTVLMPGDPLRAKYIADNF